MSARVAKVGSVGCVGFLVEGTGACVPVDEAGSCLSGGHVHVWWCILGFCVRVGVRVWVRIGVQVGYG